VGFQSLSIIKYLELLTGDIFTAWFAGYIFNEDHFLALWGDNKHVNDGREIVWDDKSTLSSDACTSSAQARTQKRRPDPHPSPQLRGRTRELLLAALVE
jgi:hypothetical protein